MMLLLWAAVALAQTITLSGRVEWSGAGPVRIEALSEDSEGQILVVSSVTLDGPGRFELAVPAGTGPLRLRAGSDPERDGIGPWAAMGIYPGLVRVGAQDIGKLDWTLSMPRVQ
ncbi:MAG: hypothetical protein ACI9VR_002305 [Cognaticolwellia sp.]|jgi:hypothetical protein